MFFKKTLRRELIEPRKGEMSASDRNWGRAATQAASHLAEEDIDLLWFIASNTDLIEEIGLDSAKAEEYIKIHGVGVRSVNSFDALRYIASYSDLIETYGADERCGLRHWIEYGFKERREPGVFVPELYVLANPDVPELVGATSANICRHWIVTGYASGRSTR